MGQAVDEQGHNQIFDPDLSLKYNSTKPYMELLVFLGHCCAV